MKNLEKHSRLFWGIIVPCLGLGACGLPEENLSPHHKQESTEVEKQLADRGRWESAAHAARVRPTAPFDDHSVPGVDDARAAQLAERDETWRDAQGRRYDAMLVLADGRAFGRHGEAPQHPVPTAENDFGANQGEPISEAESAERKHYIFTNIGDDDRYRKASGLGSFPTRTIGALSSNGNTKSGGCSGVKIGPRAVLTASHCVLAADGTWTTSGFFNPGQTNTSTATNGSFPWAGVYARDWRSDRGYDYAVIYLNDSQAAVSLGWMGAAWWNSGTDYDEVASYNRGYPAGPNLVTGETNYQKCQASPRPDKRCDGWMYGSLEELSTSDYLAGGMLSFDNDISDGQSGSPIYTWLEGWVVLGVVWGDEALTNPKAARFRSTMWNDVCSWIADPGAQSVFDTHDLCN